MYFVFQISGAVILLISSVMIKIDKQIRLLYCTAETFHKIEEDNSIILAPKRVEEITKNIILDRFAFIDLIIGYGLAFCVETNITCNYKNVISMLAITAFLTIAEFCIADFMAQIEGDKEKRIPAQDMERGLLYKEI